MISLEGKLLGMLSIGTIGFIKSNIGSSPTGHAPGVEKGSTLKTILRGLNFASY